MKTSVTMISLLLLIVGMLSGCGHQHVWNEATCTEPKTCTECGETEGSPSGHTWTAATCTEPKTCTECGETEGAALKHTWIEATCTAPKTCSVCGETEGELAEHDLNSSGKCRVCDEQIGFALNMSNWKNYLKVSYEAIRTQQSTGLWSTTGYTFTLEPITNVTFGDVKVTFEYFYKHDQLSTTQTSSFNVSETGYATGNLLNCNYAKFKAISGYIIE